MCFSLPWLRDLFIWLIVVCAVIALIRLLIPPLVAFIGIPLIGQALNIVLWAVVAIMAVNIIFALVGCLLGFGGGGGGFGFFPLRH